MDKQDTEQKNASEDNAVLSMFSDRQDRKLNPHTAAYVEECKAAGWGLDDHDIYALENNTLCNPFRSRLQ